MRIVDVCLYNGEREMLAARLDLLKDIVDEFVIVEAGYTFQGAAKPVYASSRDADLLDDVPATVLSPPPPFAVVPEAWFVPRRSWHWIRGNEAAWYRESWVRDHAKEYVLSRAPDLVCVCDVDELPDPRVLAAHADALASDSLRLGGGVYLEMHLFRYSPRWTIPGPAWRRPYAVHPDVLRHHTFDLMPRVGALPGAGWHCTFFMDGESMASKLRAYSHAEHRPLADRSDFMELVGECVRVGKDLFGGKDLVPTPGEVLRRVPHRILALGGAE